MLGAGVIGCGAIAERVYLPAFKENPQTKLIAVCDINEKRAKEIAERFNAEAYYTDFRDLLKREDIDLVAVLTPNYLHCQQTVAAAEEGKHVIVEKPMATSLEECDQMIRACEKANVKLMVGFNRRFNPIYQEIKKLIDEQAIGNIFQIRVHTMLPWTYEWWRPVSDWFKDEKKLGGGCLIDGGAHDIDMLRWFGGDVESVFAMMGTLVVKDFGGEDNALLLLRFKQNILGEMDISWSCRSVNFWMEILGDRGNIYLRNTLPQVSIEDEKGIYYVPQRIDTTAMMAYQKKKVHHFIECVLKDKEPVVTGKDGKAALQITLAAYESAKTGRIVHIST